MNLAKFFWVVLPLAAFGGLMICVLGPLAIIPPLRKPFSGLVDRYVTWVMNLK